MQIRCNFPDISYLSETQKNNFQFLNGTLGVNFLLQTPGFFPVPMLGTPNAVLSFTHTTITSIINHSSVPLKSIIHTDGGQKYLSPFNHWICFENGVDPDQLASVEAS